MLRHSILMLVGLSVGFLLSGCIQRTVTVTSEPSGALVYLNDEEVGRTPVTVPFTFYGTYDVRLEKDGYETLHAESEANSPWWEAPGPDLVAEALPGNHEVNITWNYKLNERKPADPDALVDRAKQLRATFKGKAQSEDDGKQTADGASSEQPQTAAENEASGEKQSDSGAESDSEGNAESKQDGTGGQPNQQNNN